MRSARSRFLPFVVAAAAAVGLAACGGGGSEEAGDQPPATSAATSPATPEQATAAFVRQMIPHHEMAVEMAGAADGAGIKHAELRTLAKKIASTQTREMAQLKAIARRDGIDVTDPSKQIAADAQTLGLTESALGMSAHVLDTSGAVEIDRAFIDAMIPHHDGALSMAAAVLNAGATGQVQTLAEAIVKEQAQQIADMKAWRTEWYGEAPAATTPVAGESGHEGHDMGGME